jgi:hypothetical protein
VELSTPQIVERAGPSVALIHGDLVRGTGFLARPGRLVTNAHVIQPEPLARLRVQFRDGDAGNEDELTVKELLYEDRRLDLAVLAVEPTAPGLSVAEEYHLRPGEPVTVIGYPGVGPQPVRMIPTGTMSGRTTLSGRDLYSLSIPSINPGHSGSPVFDSTGQVIGVITAEAKEQKGIAFCVPWEALRDAVQTAAAQTQSGKARLKAQHDLVAVFVRLAGVGARYEQQLRRYMALAALQPELAAQPAAALLPLADREKAELVVGDRGLVEDIRPLITRVLSETQVDRPLQDGVAELWTTYKDMKDAVGAPKGTLRSFAAQADKLTGAYRRVVNDLAPKLGLDGRE